ncbi:MAG TPA: biotin/lipoyl-containing protein [Nevskiaceae bacterium]|nr:biotin/lipoyl-containing protein [Nevskiaceae bacterium]
MHHAFKLGDAEHNVELSRAARGYRLHIGERVVPVALANDELVIGGQRKRVVIATRGDDVFVHVEGEAFQLHYEHPLERLAHQGAGAADDVIRAPMPGSVVSVAVKPGDTVTRGQTVLVMESMKMETTLTAPRDGVIEAVGYAVAQTFDRDAVLIKLEAVGAGLARDPEPQSRARRAPTKESGT